ncbi:MAG: 16S rRNA (cytidine(1402)-2'-O)-methyltransferase [Thiomicrospira sp.]|nr:MAG: 16S rRNA (cytidine(1402)-2'-O)-methyltransferase [Thiomicrospira sp.]
MSYQEKSEDQSVNNTPGRLFIVATPIGNLKDITLRALEVLENVDWIAAEDTRHSKKLLQHYGLNKKLISLHEHNELERRNELLALLKSGEQGALISDAGTPLISDPGYHLVNLLRQEQIQVEPVPGASAMIAALSASGLPTDRFSFEGFLPAKKQKRLNVLEGLTQEVRTMVFYESPHRLLESLASFVTALGRGRKIVVAKEITKQFELFFSGTVEEALSFFEANTDKVRGEFVFILKGAEAVEPNEVADVAPMIQLLLQHDLPVKQISEIVSAHFGVKKKAVYQKVLEIK